MSINLKTANGVILVPILLGSRTGNKNWILVSSIGMIISIGFLTNQNVNKFTNCEKDKRIPV